MPPLRVVLVELEGILAKELTDKLKALSVDVTSTTSLGLVERLVAEKPALAIVNLVLTNGSGFGVVNRVLRMEALAGLKIVLVAEQATADAIDAHERGPTAAAAYVRRAERSTEAFADEIADAARRLIVDELPEEVGLDDVIEVEGTGVAPAASAPRPAPVKLPALVRELGYRVLRRLRDEDGGAVFACMDDDLHRAVAVKLMPPGPGDDRERTLRFMRERRILALLQSPYVVGVYGAGTHRDVPYLVRELIEGETLAEQIAREGPLDVVAALQRVRETALGLKHAAGASVIHRDVRPENIHIVDGHAKLARFGMGKRDAPDELRITQAGLPHTDMRYVAPERVLGQEDARGDIYSLGVTLHTLVAGALPFAKSAPHNPLTGKLIEPPMPLELARPGTPPALAALVSKMMAENPADRPQDYDALLALIDDVTGGLSGAARPAAPDESSTVQGSLRHMSVTEIVQSLELARKTATVSVPREDGTEGKLAFVAGRLVHASLGDVVGDEAFFALVARREGLFRVHYDQALSLDENIKTPATGLLLEAARRSDVAASPVEVNPADALVATGSGFFAFADERPASAHSAPTAAPSSHWTRTIPTPLGFATIAVCAAAFVYAGFHVSAVSSTESTGAAAAPEDVDADAASARATASLLAKSRAQLRDARSSLAAVAPQLHALESERASAESAAGATKERAAAVATSLEAALKPDLGAHKLTLRRDADDVVLEIPEGTLFSGDGDEVTGDGKAMLGRVATALTNAELPMRVEGHSDDVEPHGRHRNNWGLSGARAMNVAKSLADQGVPAARLKAVAMADTVPLASNKGPKGRARNRRVELHLVLDAR